jgi:hypothetical protein
VLAVPTARQGFQITCFSDRHFWHEYYDKAEAHKFEAVSIGFAVNQDEIGPEVTIPMVGPFPGKRMID